MSRGQPSWSDEPGNANSISRQSEARQNPPGPSPRMAQSGEKPPSCSGFRLGVYGWRKRCLYSLVLGLMVMVIVNLALTLWLLKVMEFSSEGIGSLRVVPGGLELRGQAAVLDALVASSVRSRRGKNLVLESWSNFTASARSQDGRLLAKFTLAEDRFDCVSKSFRVTDSKGEILFSADHEEVVVGAKMLRVTGVGGAVFQGSVQTPLVMAGSGRELTLESATRTLKIRAPQKVTIESWAGELSASCLTDLSLRSTGGAIKFDAKSIFLTGLRTATPSQVGQGHPTREQHYARTHQGQKEMTVYQLCACANGKLFLAKPEGVCQADKSVC
ncbi:delta-sarcoglycan isoform X2 [Orussus abietinus]|nr:delta-sarcoglycan isoform X2 [Orussus abietinus]